MNPTANPVEKPIPVQQPIPVLKPISGYHRDDEGHWVAQLACGHNQHVRHDPPLVYRQWVKSAAGRESMIGFELGCKKCVESAPADDRPISTKNDQ